MVCFVFDMKGYEHKDASNAIGDCFHTYRESLVMGIMMSMGGGDHVFKCLAWGEDALGFAKSSRN
jgi:hypothetical protein